MKKGGKEQIHERIADKSTKKIRNDGKPVIPQTTVQSNHISNPFKNRNKNRNL